MKEKPIGIFDSGLGGLAVTSEVVSEMPAEDIVYFADFANLPYGPRKKGEVRGFVGRIVEFLLSNEVKAVVIGCNTATVAGLDKAREISEDIPVVGMINPAVEVVLNKARYEKIGVIGTAGTINSKAYNNELRKNGWENTVYGQACPELLRLAEKAEINDQTRINRLAKQCISPLLKKGIDGLILGCTDFTCVKNNLEEAAPSGVDVIDPAREVSLRVKHILESSSWNRTSKGKGSLVFYHSGRLPEKARQFASQVFNLSVNKTVAVNI